MNHLFIAFGIFSSILVSGCSNQDNLMESSEPIPLSGNGGSQSLAVVGQIASANLNIFVGFTNKQQVELHRITTDWSAETLTWNSFLGAFDSKSEGSFLPDVNGWYEVDITSLVAEWYDGTHSNYGLLLDQPSQAFFDMMLLSSEKVGYSPYIELCYQTSDGLLCETVALLTDLYINESQPDASLEGSSAIFVGNGFTAGTRKQSLIKFELPAGPAEPLISSIGGFAWNDLSQDGIKDSDELNISGVSVNLYDCSGLLQSNTITDDSGYYLFGGLGSGSFQVEFMAPVDYLASPNDQGADEMIDSDADVLTGKTICFELGDGVDDFSWSAGFYIPVVPDTSDEVCTQGIGYWINHAGFGPQDDMVSANIPIWIGDAGGEFSLFVDSDQTAVNIFSMEFYGTPENGITKLCAQLLATRMNIVTGVSDAEVAAAISDADVFIATHHWESWDGLESLEIEAVTNWKDLFDSFNNGELGTASCDSNP